MAENFQTQEFCYMLLIWKLISDRERTLKMVELPMVGNVIVGEQSTTTTMSGNSCGGVPLMTESSITGSRQQCFDWGLELPPSLSFPCLSKLNPWYGVYYNCLIVKLKLLWPYIVMLTCKTSLHGVMYVLHSGLVQSLQCTVPRYCVNKTTYSGLGKKLKEEHSPWSSLKASKNA